MTSNLLNGYICRCFDGTVQMTNCSLPKNPCLAMPCGTQGRCLALTAAPKGYMCMCQQDGITYTTIDTCPSERFYRERWKTMNNSFSCQFILYSYDM